MIRERTGESLSETDFSAELELAFRRAQLLAPEDPHSNGSAPNRFRHAPDEMVLDMRFTPEPDCVYTTDPNECPALIGQAAAVLDRYSSNIGADSYADQDEMARKLTT
jgi:hypothetical protein